jgi:hypothetical protein
MDRGSQRVAAAFSRMQERDGLRSHAGGRSRFVPEGVWRQRGGARLLIRECERPNWVAADRGVVASWIRL